jgi:hypothetical protein
MKDYAFSKPELRAFYGRERQALIILETHGFGLDTPSPPDGKDLVLWAAWGLFCQLGIGFKELDKHLKLDYPELRPIRRAHNPASCPNCGSPTDPKTLYCTEVCGQRAEHVRYIRKGLMGEKFLDYTTWHDGVGAKHLFVLTDIGYPKKQRALSKVERAAVIRRDEERCVRCGGRGEQIDHRGATNALEMLQLTCKQCNLDLITTRARDNYVAQSDVEERAAIETQIAMKKRFAIESQIACRILSPVPLNECDDEVQWNSRWRTYKKTGSRAGEI